MDGKMIVTYKILCKNDFNLELTLEKLFANEKIAKTIKSEFAKGIRNIDILTKDSEAKIKIETKKELYKFEVDKNDFADLITLSEEDAKKRNLAKKDCADVELVNIETID